MNETEIICLHVECIFSLTGNPKSTFVGPIKKGLRLILWGESYKKATSCSFIKNLDLKIGEKGNAEIVILSPKSINKTMETGEIYSIGTPGIKIGEILISKIIGQWTGKVP